MKQTIEIEVPDGKKAVWKYNKIIFEDIKPQLPKTWEEFCKQNMIKKSEYYLNPSSCILELRDDKREIFSDRNVLPTRQAAEAHLALMQLHQLRDCYRGNTLSMYWYSIIMRGESDLIIVQDNNRFLSFPTRELAEEFLANFKDLIEEAGDLI